VQFKHMEEMLMGTSAKLQVQGSIQNQLARSPSSALAPGAGGVVRDCAPAMAVAGAGACADAGSTDWLPQHQQKEKALNCPQCISVTSSSMAGEVAHEGAADQDLEPWRPPPSKWTSTEMSPPCAGSCSHLFQAHRSQEHRSRACCS
jgi:hypothetical protein